MLKCSGVHYHQVKPKRFRIQYNIKLFIIIITGEKIVICTWWIFIKEKKILIILVFKLKEVNHFCLDSSGNEIRTTYNKLFVIHSFYNVHSTYDQVVLILDLSLPVLEILSFERIMKD